MLEHWDAVEADLQRFYRLHVDDVGTPRLSWGRLIRLVTHLPASSAWARTQYRGEEPWGTTEFLLRNLLAAWTGKAIESPQERLQAGAKIRRLSAELAELHERSERRRKEVADGRS